ncbi:hypothetical protein LEM8419_00555 [Neolewinella maritima]|uniref:DUF427 domain-containing protein n=1 Tax=Neolewinella maritima TaxID=1383882 RepID=A0ABM9AXM4_9BACT|nr:DUF427 domain-containing protein [Neolewinella maritima]CAH0999258.1 hypothetical protein LEM8419_00555 [Neolewinella maritima]
MKAIWNGQVIAESPETLVVEGNHYFPADSVRQEFLRDSATTSYCGWKGDCRYYTLEVDGKSNPDAAWYYADPLPRAEHIRGHVAFWKGVTVQDQ